MNSFVCDHRIYCVLQWFQSPGTNQLVKDVLMHFLAMSQGLAKKRANDHPPLDLPWKNRKSHKLKKKKKKKKKTALAIEEPVLLPVEALLVPKPLESFKVVCLRVLSLKAVCHLLVW